MTLSLFLAIVHTVTGCHVWQSTHTLGAATTVKLQHGGKLTLRATCPMDFELRQVSGRRVALGDRILRTGTQRTIVFKLRGTYVLRAHNVQSPADVGLQTLGPDNTMTLTVRVA